jgi:hypothetical protein
MVIPLPEFLEELPSLLINQSMLSHKLPVSGQWSVVSEKSALH